MSDTGIDQTVANALMGLIETLETVGAEGAVVRLLRFPDRWDVGITLTGTGSQEAVIAQPSGDAYLEPGAGDALILRFPR